MLIATRDVQRKRRLPRCWGRGLDSPPIDSISVGRLRLAAIGRNDRDRIWRIPAHSQARGYSADRPGKTAVNRRELNTRRNNDRRGGSAFRFRGQARWIRRARP